ncbi:MAG: polysaccharide biosynthesis/export family protein [bacterium]
MTGWLVVLVVALLAGCGPRVGPGSLPPVPDLAKVQAGAALGPGDVVEIRVYQEKELSGLYRLSSDGTFRFPLVGEVNAEGMSPGQLSEVLVGKLRDGFLRDPQVSVLVKEFNSKKIFVLGMVAKPGTFPFEDEMTIVQAVTLAGGLTPLAEKNGIVLTRTVEGQERKFVVPFEQIGLGRAPNVVLEPGDIVFVPESWL